MSLLHPCPYCGSDKVAREETDLGGYVVACPCCGMCGPEAPYACIANRRWNELCAKMCRHCNVHLVQVNKELRKKLHELESGNDDVELGRVDDA